MPKGVDKIPVVEGHFARIGDQSVIDEISTRLERVHDEEGQQYSHDTYIGNSPIYDVIAKRCANVYSATMTPEEVWKAAEINARSGILALAEGLNEYEEDSFTYKSILEDARELMKARLVMYALDCPPDSTEPIGGYPINDLLDASATNAGRIRQIYTDAVNDLRDKGVVVMNDNKPRTVDSLLDEYKGDLAVKSYQDILYYLEALDSVEDSSDRSFGIINRTKQSRANLREWAGWMPDNYGSLNTIVAVVAQKVDEGHFDAIDVLDSLPYDYISQLNTIDPTPAKNAFESIIANYAATGKGGIKPLGLLHDYYQGGFSGQAASQSPDFAKIVHRFGSVDRVIIEALPIKQPNTERQISDHNHRTRRVIGDYAKALLGESDMTEQYVTDTLAAIEPRAFKDNGAYKAEYHVRPHVLGKLEYAVEKYGADTVLELHKDFGLDALDCLRIQDIDVMAGLHAKDPELIKQLQAADVTLMLYDYDGTYNGIAEANISQLSDKFEDLRQIALPVRRPSDIDRHVQWLDSLGIECCTVVIAAHGNESLIGFGRGSNSFELRGMNNKQEPYMSAKYDNEGRMVDPPAKYDDDGRMIALPENEEYYYDDDNYTLKNTYDIGPIMRRLARAMVKPKHTATTGAPNRKRIILSTCHGRDSNGTQKSIAETAALKTRSEGVQIVAGDDVTTVGTGHGDGLWMGQRYDHEEPNMVAMQPNSVLTEWIRHDGVVVRRRTRTKTEHSITERMIA